MDRHMQSDCLHFLYMRIEQTDGHKKMQISTPNKCTGGLTNHANGLHSNMGGYRLILCMDIKKPGYGQIRCVIVIDCTIMDCVACR